MKSSHLTLIPERGQAIVLIALMIAGFAAFVGLALDGGQVFEMRRQAQNAADAGALAAVDEAAEGQNVLVHYRINQYAVGNSSFGNKADSFTAEYYSSDGKYTGSVPVAPGTPPPLGTDCVRVKTAKTFNTLIISFLGFDTLTVNATAAGCFGQVTPTGALWPMAIYTQTFVMNQTYDMWGDEKEAPGQFGWLSYDGSNSASGLWPKLQDGYAGPYQVYNSNPCDGSGNPPAQQNLSLPNCIKGAPGVKASDQGPAATQLNQTVVIPIYDHVTGNGSNTFYHIVGFAAFYVTGVCLQGGGEGDCSGTHGKDIKGKFVNYVVTGQFCKTNCGPDYGLKAIKLSQ